MQIEFDPAKNEANHAKHGLYLSDAASFDWATAMCRTDDRINYNEVRITCVGYIETRLHVIVYTQRGQSLRVISLRKANQREVREYAKA
jgi:uncharacterized DUF497 family protein